MTQPHVYMRLRHRYGQVPQSGTFGVPQAGTFGVPPDTSRVPQEYHQANTEPTDKPTVMQQFMVATDTCTFSCLLY